MLFRGFLSAALLIAAIPAAAKDLTGLFASGKAPYFWTEGDAAKGVELEIVEAVLRRAGYVIHPRAMPNNRLRATFGEADIDFAGGQQPTDLSGYCHSSVYMAYHNVAITKRSRHIQLDRPEALLGYQVAIRQSLYHDLTLDRQGGKMPAVM